MNPVIRFSIKSLVACISLAAAAPTTAEDIDIPYTKVVLENGLTVIIHEDHKAPIVAVNIWYHVGSKNEKPGRIQISVRYEAADTDGLEGAQSYTVIQIEDNGGGKGGSRKGRGGSSDKKLPASNKKFYVVKDGDILGKIAVKVYGLEIGKKQATRDMIFKANSHILSSPDDINIGQKLIMPSLNGEKEQPVIESMVTEKKRSGPIGKFTKAVKNVFGKKSKQTPLYALYVVKDDESLWGISSKRLGSGSRWPEIQKINKGILNGSKVVLPGMKLKIPQK